MNTKGKDIIRLSDHFTTGRLLRFVMPSVIMMVFTSIYGVVDGLFVSNFAGKTAFAAINLIMPFIMILGAVGFMLGTGGSALVAKTLGEGDTDRANRYFTMIFISTLISGIVISTLGFIFTPQIAALLGADSEMLPSCVAYGRVVIAFNTAFMLQNLFQGFFVTAQKPKLGLFFTVASGVTNMILDALFVGAFDWGVVGAAAATGISQVIGGVIPVFYFIKKNDSLLRFVPTKLEARAILATCGNGSSEMMNNVSSSIVSIVFNFVLMKYASQNGVAAYGVLMYVNFIYVAVFIGYSIGSAPIVSYHYGAQNHSEMRNMLKKGIILMLSTGVVMTVLAYILAPVISKIFVGYDSELCEFTIRAFRIYSPAFLLCGFNIMTSSFFTALNNGAISALVSFLRTLVFQLINVLLFPLIFDSDGIWLAMLSAEILSFIVSAIFLAAKRKKYGY